MSTFQQHRCGHCHISYSYQTSGYGGIQDHNHPNYCQTCAQVVEKAIRAALKPVPVLFDKEWRPTQDIAIAELDRIDAENIAKASAKGGFPVSRALAPLFDMERPGNVHHQKIVSTNGCTYRYEWWTDEGVEHGIVYLECEVEVATGKVTGPWSQRGYWKTPPTFYTPGPKPPRKPPTHEFKAKPMTAPSTSIFFMQSYPLISGEGNSLKDMVPIDDEAFLKHVDEAQAKLPEPLPDGVLPVYNEHPTTPKSDEDEPK